MFRANELLEITRHAKPSHHRRRRARHRRSGGPGDCFRQGRGATAAAIGNPTPLQVNLPAESEWTFCATEGARCEFTGTQQVRYGANGKFTLPRTFTDGVACDNATFADPAPGVVKQCQIVR